MNRARVIAAALGATAAYFVLGFIAFGMISSIREEYAKYPAIYRTAEAQSVMPMGAAAIFGSVLVLAYLFGKSLKGNSGAVAGTRFGALAGVFAVCAFVLHNHADLNIGWALMLKQSVAYFVEWTITGTVIGMIYRPNPG